jgi:hypothetical protein
MTARFSGVGARALTALCAFTVTMTLGVTSVVLPVHADPLPPAPWPDTALARPQMEATAHTLRLFGPDRYQTGLAIALSLRGVGTYPFNTTDRSSSGATSLGGASNWWGAKSCPRAIIVVAGDSPADALAAAALSDPTGNSSEPFLQRTAAADPLFDPIGGFARVDTDAAPVLVTRSARSGATALSPATPDRRPRFSFRWMHHSPPSNRGRRIICGPYQCGHRTGLNRLFRGVSCRRSHPL